LAAPVRFGRLNPVSMRAGSHEREELVASIHRLRPYVARVLTRILGSDPDLPDIVQDIFVQALTGIDTLRDPTLVRPWMRSIAVFVAFRIMRQRRRQRLFIPEDELADIPGDPSLAGYRHALMRVRRVLERIPENERELFTMRYIGGLELKEISDACGISLATTKRHLIRAQSRFFHRASNDAVLADWVRAA
jgi:RNA polymerase sigma-70 factor (ECF subfamily)